MSIDADLLRRVLARATTLADDRDRPLPATMATDTAMKAEGLRPTGRLWSELFVAVRSRLLHGEPTTIVDVPPETILDTLDEIFEVRPEVGFRDACRELMRRLNIVGDFDETVRTIIEMRRRERATTPPLSLPDTHGEDGLPKETGNKTPPKKKRHRKERADPQGRLGLIFPPEPPKQPDEGDRS